MNGLLGQELGPYRILEQIGAGGMATVYQAYHAAMDRYVAVKLLSEQMGHDAELRQRFQREAKVIARLEHIHILPVYDYGEAEGRLYLVMRYVQAGTLKDRLAAGPMDLTEVNRVLRQVGEALDYAHRLGVVHRDIKPSNVLLDAQGDCYLTDFGLAKMMEGSVQLTATGVGLGTPAYMSPEQGQGEKADARSDIYSLGVMLYEMVTGQVPYEAETPMAVVLKHIHAPLPLPHEVKPGVPAKVEQVILKAMAKNPTNRFQTAGGMVAAFDVAMRAADGQAKPEMPVGQPPAMEATVRVPEPTRIHRTPWGWLTIGGTAGVVALLVSCLLLSRLLPKIGERKVTATPEVTPAATPTTTVVAHATASPTVAVTSTSQPTVTSTPTVAPTKASPKVAVVKWIYDAPDTIWYLDSWGDGLATGNLNGDGVPDVALGTQGGHVIALNGVNGAELWSYQITGQTDGPVNADVADVDGDGIFDVVATGKGDTTSQGKAIICALDSNGIEKWQALGDFEEAVDLAYGDIDGDGDTDVAASVGTYSWGGGQVLLFDGTTGTQVWSQSLGGGHAQGIDALDVDGDGDMEIAVENYDNQVFLLDGSSGDILWSRPKNWYGRDVIIKDVDKDGTPEIVSGAGGVACFDPDGARKWVGPEKEGGNISAGDVNGDGRIEVVFSDGFSGETYVLDGNTGETLWFRTRSGAHAVGDVDGNGGIDIIVGTIRFWGIEAPYSVDALDGANHLLWSYPLDTIHNEGGFGLATANLDDDPALEVLVANGPQLLALDVAGVTSVPASTN